MKYKVLWIDDNPKDQDGFEDFAYVNGIELIHFKTSREGREELERNVEKYDAVILDGLVFDESTEEVPAVTGMQNSIHKLKELKTRKAIPYFVFTGHLGDDKYGVVREMLANETIFYKAKDNQKLIDAIKEAANQQELTQLKHKYPNAFALCEDDYLGAKQFDRVLQLVKDIETPENIANTQGAIVEMRKVLEAIFSKLNTIGLIPDEIQNNPGAINGASSFLAGNNKDYQYNEELIHPVIAEKTHHLLKLTQDAAHNEGHSLRADSYLTASSNSYLYLSLCFSLLEVLDYIKGYIDANAIKEVNQSKWSKKEIDVSEISGKIVQDNGGHYSCEGYLLNYIYIQDNGYKVGDNIKITEITENTNPRTSETYKMFGYKFQKLN